MDKKIMFWFSADLLPFCIAYYLQKNNNSDLFGIFDITNKPKDFFKTQNLIKLSKTWFYHDNIKFDSDYDSEYLNEIQKKYEIDLQELINHDRILNHYNEYYTFSDSEKNIILYNECKLFEKILNEINPDYFITTETTLQPHHLFYEMCRKRGVKVLMLNHANWKNLCYISEQRHKIDNSESSLNIDLSNNASFDILQKILDDSKVSKFHKKFHKENKNSKKSLLQAAAKFMSSSNDNIKSHYTYFGRTKSKVLLKEFQDSINKKNRQKFIDDNLFKKIEKDEPFIYMPLHQEPERSLLIAAPKFSNQMETIKEISKKMPKNFQLYVKEHPTQGPARNWRDISFYSEVMNIKNVKLFHPNFNPKFLFQNCKMVVSVGGTSSFEAAFYGKPSIIFADLGYALIPCIKKLNSYNELKQSIEESINTEVNPQHVQNYIKFLEKNSFKFDILNFESKYANWFYMNGNLVDINFDSDKMTQFLNNNKSELENLTMEFINKMNHYENEVVSKLEDQP
tara:strand:- start:3525 stop:5057 length:1533 start_codon:yes stop_codon:yes gene_type:complete